MSTWEKYRDMIDLPYPGESKHTRMPVRDRAAQFAPFAALTGFGAVLKETERITEKRIELDEYEKDAFYGAQRSPFCFRTAAFRSQRPPIF